MKKYLYIILFIFSSVYCFAQEQTLRVSVIGTLDTSNTTAEFRILSPAGGTIYVGGDNNTIVTNPLFVDSNNETLLCFQYSHPCYCMHPNHTLFITNSAGWDTEIPVGTQYYFSQMVPLNPSGDTVITIEFRNKKY
ncbi:MAG: hypothetical protein J6C92_02755 [Bacteroidaceae bacterium]|nr:hypothetical protein [Bacteroidaceae bacterium]